MTILFADPSFEKHETGAHPESPARLRAIARAFADDPLARAQPRGAIRTAAAGEILSVHEQAVIAAAKSLAERGGGFLDADTVVSPASFTTALAAAGSAVAAVDEVMTGRHQTALCLVRPPGHHATRERSMGFCLFNNVAVAARHAQAKHGIGRVLIVDWDVHHGNGTQDIFYDVEEVVFYSIHRHPFYPGTGKTGETGTGKGLGATINVPIAAGTPRGAYLAQFRAGLERAAAVAKPELILISAGFDAHVDDPIGGLGLETEDFEVLTRDVRDVAATYCGGRIVSCLEGGYDLAALAKTALVHFKGLI